MSIDNDKLQPQKDKKLREKLSRLFKQKREMAELQEQSFEDKDEQFHCGTQRADAKCKTSIAESLGCTNNMQRFVCTVCQKSTRPTLLRSYDAEDNMERIYKVCKVWEAVRATTTATTIFDPISIGKYGETFIDARNTLF